MLHYALDYKELLNEYKQKVVIDGNSILITLLAEKVYAIQDKCTHMGASLSKGKIENSTVTCKFHGATFDLETGEVTKKPHISFIKMSTKPAKVYQVIIKDEKVYIEMS